MKKKLGIAFGITAVSILAVVGIFAGIAAQSDGAGDGKRSFCGSVGVDTGFGFVCRAGCIHTSEG